MSLLGVYCPNDPTRVTAFEAFMGRPVDLAMLHTGRNGWADFDGCPGWLAGVMAPLPRRQHWSVPLIPSWGATLEEAATGKYDAHYTLVAKAILAARPRGVIYVRTGWEMNGDWQPWASKGREAVYIAAFIRFVKAFRAVSSRFQFEWCPNVGLQSSNPELAYPGDDVVDVIGLDCYFNPDDGLPAGAAENFAFMLERPYGLRWHKGFAASRGKPRAFTEWGVCRPGFEACVQAMAAWVSAPDVLWHGYWDEAQFAVRDGKLGSSGAAMQAAFG
jgi:hypothetical protein